MSKIKFYNIHLGNEIYKKVIEKEVSVKDLMIIFRCSKNTIHRMYQSPCLKTDILLKWCIVLDYNFFSILANEYIKLKKNSMSL